MYGKTPSIRHVINLPHACAHDYRFSVCQSSSFRVNSRRQFGDSGGIMGCPGWSIRTVQERGARELADEERSRDRRTTQRGRALNRCPWHSAVFPSLPRSLARSSPRLRACGRIDEFLGVDGRSPGSNTEQSPMRARCVQHVCCCRVASRRYSETATSAAGCTGDAHHFGTRLTRLAQLPLRPLRRARGLNSTMRTFGSPVASCIIIARLDMRCVHTFSPVVFLAYNVRQNEAGRFWFYRRSRQIYRCIKW